MPFVSDRAMGLPPLQITPEMHLHTIPSGTAYALCKSLLCNCCGHLFSSYRFDDEEMTRLYKDYRGADYCLLRDHYEPGYVAQNAALCASGFSRESIEAFLSPLLKTIKPRILDWGGDTGLNTPFVDRAELIHIFEPSGILPEVPCAINVAEPNDFLPSYDLLVLSNVLEHMPWPIATLEMLVKRMNFNSVLFIEVPFESIQCEIEEDRTKRPLKFHWHEHVNFFSQLSMSMLLKACGLKIVGSETQAVDRGASGVSSSKALRVACARTL